MTRAKARLLAVVAAVLLLALGGVITALTWLPSRPVPDDLAGFTPGEGLGGPFILTDTAGEPFGTADLAGAPALLYFGYTYCPDICPTELVRMSGVVDRLTARDLTVQPVFVTVDPQRDTAPALAAYVPLFSPDLIGLLSPPEVIAEIAGRYGVFYDRIGEPGDNQYYLMDHTSFIYLLDSQGHLVRMFTAQDSVDGITEAVAALVG